MKTLKTILFYVILIALLVAGMAIDLSAGNKLANKKQHLLYAIQADKCKSAQRVIQSSGHTSKVWKNQQSKLFRK